MKKLYILLLFVTSWVNAQIVNIPDANFKAKLLNASTTNFIASTYYNFDNFNTIPNNFVKIDVNNDGEIQYSEAQNIQFLEISNSGVFDLTGIEAFVNLKALYANFNHLGNVNLSQNGALRELYIDFSEVTDLNLTQNTNLRVVFCRNNLLTSLNISQNLNLVKLYVDFNNLTQLSVLQNSVLESLSTQNNNNITVMNISQNLLLKVLICSGNNISMLDVTSHPLLEYLIINNNPLSNINITQNPNLLTLVCSSTGLDTLDISSNDLLEELNIGYNQLSAINVSQLTALKRFDCSTTQITELDLSLNLNLEHLSCSFNSLTSLDLSNNLKLNSLLCQGNQLEYLNIKNGSIEELFWFNNNPNLQYICADEGQIASIEAIAGSTVHVNSYCSFVPGGHFNTISGSMIFDANNNGCDASDLPQPNIKININDGIAQGATFTNNTGNYSFFTQTGNFILTPNVENPSWFNFSPISATVPFTNNDNNVVTQNFCITPNGVHPDLEIVILPVFPARPGFDAVYKIVYKNKGNHTVGGTVNFTFNEAVLDFLSASIVPTSSGNGYMNWLVPALSPFQTGTILVTFNVNSPQEIPAVNINDVLTFNANIGLTTDVMPNDNLFNFEQIVVGSYDPNDITCLQGNALPIVEMGTFLHYNIRFENTGTAAAENVVIKSEIDLTQYNIQSLQVMESSHAVNVRVTGNIVEFIHQGIQLDAGGHGNILLKLKSNATLSQNTVINSADIYFDYNFPIVTNDEQTVFADLSKNDFNKELIIQIYPNPVQNELTIKAKSLIDSIQLYDAQGRIIFAKSSTQVRDVIDMSNYGSGIYFITISTSEGRQTQKIIKK
jgi:Leucine-rich repeat (LRR) protein